MKKPAEAGQNGLIFSCAVMDMCINSHACGTSCVGNLSMTRRFHQALNQ